MEYASIMPCVLMGIYVPQINVRMEYVVILRLLVTMEVHVPLIHAIQPMVYV